MPILNFLLLCDLNNLPESFDGSKILLKHLLLVWMRLHP